MFRIALSFGWQTPVIPSWSDHTEGGEFARNNFYRWLINAHVDRSGGGSSLLSWRLLGFYVTAYLSHFWKCEEAYR